MAITFLAPMPYGEALFTFAAAIFPVALMALGAARGGRLGPVAAPLLVLLVLLVLGTAGVLASRGEGVDGGRRLIDAGLNSFNPFQPEVMDLDEILPMYRGRLAFHGGLSMQKTLPFGTYVKVTRTDNEKSVVVKINDRGPYIKERIIV